MLTRTVYTTPKCKICGSEKGLERVEVCNGMVSMQLCSKCRQQLNDDEIRLRVTVKEVNVKSNLTPSVIRATALEIKRGQNKWKKLRTYKG